MPPYSLASGKRVPIAGLAKGLAVLEALVAGAEGASPAELVARTGLERTTVQRILRTLTAEGYVSKSGHGQYHVAPRAFSLGLGLSRGSQLARTAKPYLDQLGSRVQEATNLAVLDGLDVLYVARSEPNRSLSDTHTVGSRLPAYCTSLGRAILAFGPEERAISLLEKSDRSKVTDNTVTDFADLLSELARVREQGYAMVNSELEKGLVCISAPVWSPSGGAFAAMNISIPEIRVDDSTIEEYVPLLLDTARMLSADLGWEQAPPAALGRHLVPAA